MSGRRPSALGRLSVTAGAAALAAQSELDPLANAQVESAIPDDLKEHPPPESLFSLDKRMEELLMDIRNLMESRGKDWQGTSGRKDRVPGISWVTRLENFKQHRAEWIERIMRVEVPKRWEGIGKVVGSELEGYWNVDVNLTREKLLYILQEFYCLKSTLMAEQNALLLSRWTRFCRTSYDISKYLPMFQRYQEYLQAEYTDAVDRYERLSEAWERRERLIREELAKAEAERIERERRGIIPPRKADKDKNTPGKQSQSEAAPAPAAESDPLYTVADLVVFLRYVITAMAGRKDVEMFLQRARLLAHSDRSAILRDYRAVCTVKPSQGALEVLGILEGVNNYVENPPVKFPRVEDFITEFDLLVAHYMFQTPIAREDGRPFAYEAESVFTTVFLEQSNEATMAPYDLGDSSEWNLRKDNGSDDIKDKHGDKASLAAMAGLFTHQGFKNPDTPRFRRADWLKNMEIFPELEEWQEAQIEFIRQKRDIDFELRYEHDFLMSNDIELVINRLRDASRRTHEANGAPSARPSSGRTQSQDQSDYPRPSVPSQQRDSGPSKPFEWGMKVPDPWDVEVEKDFRVLDAKKQTFGLLLKANDEKRHVEKEITGIPTAENSGSLLPSTAIVDPTVTTLFAPHETLSYLYLRHVRTRQLRATLLSQLNYFRSIEKRIVTAYQLMKRRQLSTDAPDDPDHRGRTPLARAAVVTHMWAQQELFDMPDPNSADATSATGNNDGCDDVQQIIDGKLVIKDAQGVAFIYDAAIDDMKGLEKAMLRIATAYINAAAVGQSTRDLSIDKDTLEREKIYEEEMRFKLSERKTDYNDAHYTFLNPDLDRSQLLLEMYDHEVKFQYAKIELINIYLEVYENTYDPTRITRITQIITDLMHLRPTFDFEGQTYFSRSYTLCTKALQLHAQTVLPMLQHGLEKHRDWVKKYFGRQDPTASRNDDDAEAIPEMNFNHGFKRVVDSPVMAGLPAKEDIERETITMHHAGCIVNMTEFIPTADAIIEVYDTAKAVCSEMSRVVSGLLLHAHMASAKDMPKHRLSRPAVECTVWKGLYATWQTLSTACFQIRQPRTRRLIGQLNADIWMENPLLPDLLLTDVYVPEMTDRALNVHFAAMTPFTDANFNTTGCDIGHRLLKVLVTRDRLMGIWLETEYLRKVYELQFPQMGVNMNAYSGRLNSLRFDLPEMADNTAIEDDNDDENGDATDSVAPIAMGSEEEDRPTSTPPFSTTYPKLGPLAIVEMDEQIAMAIMTPNAAGAFDMSTLGGIKTATSLLGMKQIRLSLKAQLVEKYWFMAAVEIQDVVLHEIHTKILSEGELDLKKPSKEKSQLRRAQQRVGSTRAQPTFDVDYRLLVTSVVPKKKALRRWMLAEYAKELKVVSSRPELSEEERDAIMGRFRESLWEWYHSNMVELVIETCEKAEYLRLMMDFRETVLTSTYGRLLYRPSKIKRHFDYFANNEAVAAETETDGSKLNMDSVQTQEVVSTDANGTEKICKLWYIPYATEILLHATVEKASKGTADTNLKLYKNHLVFRKAVNIQRMMMDIFVLISIYAFLLQDNRRYALQVRQMREADYVVNTVNAIKKDLSYLGSQADYGRVEHYLSAKWQLWVLKLRLTLSSSAYTVGMNLMSTEYVKLLSHHDRVLSKEQEAHSPRSPLSSLLTLSSITPSVHRLPRLSPLVFSALPASTKRICDRKITELEETLDEYLQATLLNFGENAEEVNKSQNEFLTTGLKLLALRRTFLRRVVPEGIVNTEEQRTEFFSKYKMRILVPSVRYYHKLGAKGNASVPLLLGDDMVTAAVDFDFNRIAQAAFDKCQLIVLQNELMREHTANLIREARALHARLTDERSGRLFKVYDAMNVPSSTGERSFGFRLAEEDYVAKTTMMNDFTKDLMKSNAIFLKEIQEAQKPSNKGPRPTFDDPRFFACTKDMLSQAIIRLAHSMVKWQQKRRGEQEHFMGTLTTRLLEMLQMNERLIQFLAHEKTELMQNYQRDVRIHAFHLTLPIQAELAQVSTQLQAVLTQRHSNERQIRHRILDEYDDLVHELVMEINVLRNRFSEYRINTFQEVMNIMSEAKKEELRVVVKNKEMPEDMRESAKWMISHEEQAELLRQENHELKMTLLKLRSMYVIKEQSLRSMYEKKTRKLTESTKTAEEKLWESYREAEARERTLRRHIAKLQKTLSQKESELDSIHRQVQSEHSRPPPRGLKTPPDASAKVAALQQKLSHYESLHVDNIMAELAEKTRLVEVLMAQRGEFGAGGLAGDDPSPRPKTSTGVPARRKLRTASARLSKPPMVIKTILPRRKGLGPYSDYSHPSPDDQPRQMDIVQMLQLENSSLREKLRQYEREREVGVGQSLQNSTRKSVGWNDQQVAARPLVGLESDQSDNEKDRPSGSAKSYRAVPKFVDAKPQTAVRESSRDNDIVIPSVLRTPNTSRPSSSQPQLRPLTRPRTSH